MPSGEIILPLKYEPVGDVDGDARLDGIAGIDHMVLNAKGEEVAVLASREDAEQMVRVLNNIEELVGAAEGLLYAMGLYGEKMVNARADRLGVALNKVRRYA